MKNLDFVRIALMRNLDFVRKRLCIDGWGDTINAMEIPRDSLIRRKMYDRLVAWKRESDGRTAVMIDGARRVGKSTVATAFAEAEYETYLLIDFTKAGRRVKDLFEEYLDDLDTFFLYLQNLFHVELKPRRSLVIFDEVQRFPRAREAIKHLVADGRYDYIETGSLISLRKNVRDILIPSEERHFEMFPMDFEEFLWARGAETAVPLIRDCLGKRRPLGAAHRGLMDLFRQYMVIGGMPQAVAEFVRSGNLAAVDGIKRDILRLYRDDIHKYAGALRFKVESVFEDIPSQLGRHEKRFSLAVFGKNARMREWEPAFEWLAEAMTVNLCHGATEPNVGLRLNLERSALKCYLADTGLLTSFAFDENALAADDIHNRLLFDRIEVNEGMLVENVVAQMLRAAGRELYFYSNASREVADDRMEIDFLLAKTKLARRRNIIPIEVKSGRNYTTRSLDKFRAKYRSFVDTPIVLHPGDLRETNGILFLPLYMTPFL